MTRSALLFRLLTVAVLLPLAIGAIAVVVMVGWLPGAPSAVIVHWGVDANQTGSPSLYPTLVAIVVPGLAVIFGILIGLTVRAGKPSPHQKLLAAVSFSESLLISGLSVALLGIQRQPGPNQVIDNPTGVVVAGVVVAAALGVGAWFALPPASAGVRAGAGVPARPLPLAGGERAVWIHRATTPTALVVVLVGVLLVVAAGAAVGILIAGPVAWIMVVLPVLIIVMLATTIHWNVRVDDSGLTASGALGFPRFHVPLSDVRSASAVNVNPLVDFGGWGIRRGMNRRFGLVTRSGEALEVLRTDGRAFVVTVDDAAGAAALLAALVARV
ncbi:MAG: hypothetical protein JWR53_1234 [Glaciihabitans sp.]|nr:hypothetical protein [Glaciihabitans sp.]